MSFGFGFGFPKNYIAALFSPAQLFTGSINGVWYDPSDLSTLFQDAAGTIPVTAVEQPVGLMLDKSGRGNHAFQTASANRPVLSARVNLLTKTEKFGDAAWSAVGTSVVSDVTIAPDGTLSADKIVPGTVSGNHSRFQIPPTIVGVKYTQSFYAKAGEYRYIYISPNGPWSYQRFDLLTGVVGPLLSGFLSASMTPDRNGWYRCEATWIATSTANGNYIWAGNNVADVVSFTGDGTSGIYIWGADLRVTNTGVNLPPYQRVNTSTDYDTTGFPLYLLANGTNSAMQTNSIDFTATDKMTVWAGVRKLSDAERRMLMELSTTGLSTGAFNLEAPDSASNTYKFASGGSISPSSLGVTGSGYTAPITNVLTGIAAISTPVDTLRINGTQAATSSASQGTGNYGNYPLYLFARAGTSLWFNGRLYGLVIAGKSASASEIASTEAWLNSKTGAY